MIAAAIASVVWAKIGGRIFAKYVPNQDPPMWVADSARRLDVMLLFDHKHLPAGKGRENGSLNNSDRNNRTGQVRLRKAASSPMLATVQRNYGN